MELFRYTLYFFISLLALAGIMFLFARLEQGRRVIARRVLGKRAAELPPGVRTRRILRLVFAGLALFFLIAAACVPQWGVELAPVTDLRGSIIVAIDVSLSMAAKDLKPSRLDNARMLLNDISDRFSEYRMGIVAFSGKAYTQCPLTDDAEAIRYFAAHLKPGMLPVQGTDFSSAIFQTLDMTEKMPGTKVMIMITDGEDHSSEVDFALKAATEADLRIFPVGMGSPDGELIPITDSNGNNTGYKKDRNGKPVISRLDENLLMRMAATTGAAYMRYVSPDKASEALLSSINRIELEKTRGKGRAAFKNRYQWPLSFAFFFLLLELLLMDRNLFSGFRFNMRFGRKMGVFFITFAFLTLFLPSITLAESAKSLAREGNDLFRQGKFEEAKAKYEKAAEKSPKDRKIRYNLGVAQYKNGEFDKSIETFDNIDDRKLAVKTEFNKANAQYKQQNTEEAVKCWKKVLRLDPSNEDAKFNLQKIIQDKQKNQNDQNNQNNQNNQDKKDNQDKQNQQNNNQDQKDNKNNSGQDNKDNGKDGQGDKNKDKDGKNDKGNKDKGDDKEDQKLRDQQKQKEKREREQAMRLLNMMSEKEKNDAQRQQAQKSKANGRQQQLGQPEEDW